jgi:hypothetical protein
MLTSEWQALVDREIDAAKTRTALGEAAGMIGELMSQLETLYGELQKQIGTVMPVLGVVRDTVKEWNELAGVKPKEAA